MIGASGDANNSGEMLLEIPHPLILSQVDVEHPVSGIYVRPVDRTCAAKKCNNGMQEPKVMEQVQ